MGLTRFVLKRPVTTVLVVLSILVFGISALSSSPLELTPEMNMPMMVISTIYPGASPEDVNDLVSKPIEDEVGILNGIKSTSAISNENMSLLLLEYEYGMDMDKAYSDLKKKVDAVASTLPEEVSTPVLMEFNMNDQPTMTLAVNHDSVENLYNYTNDQIVPELEKLSSVATVELSGGQKDYIRVELIPEKLNQYHLDMNAVASSLGSASFSFPVGSAKMGDQDLVVTSSVEYETAERLKQVPIMLGNGNLIYLEDVANIYLTLDEAESIGRYNGNDTISLSIKKQQKSSAVDVSEDVTRVINRLQTQEEGLEMIVVNDNSEMITSSLKTVFNTMILAVVISMLVIFFFFGDWKASLIVGSSIPISIMVALIMMNVMGFSLNVITLSSLVLGVGMMVDNSIVVLESCFRATRGSGFREYKNAALEGSNIVIRSIIGSTATTCVVFLPLALVEGMSGQMFQPLGFTIIFCMLASLLSAVTIVPLCYCAYRPKEKEDIVATRIMEKIQNAYRSLMEELLPKKKTVMFTTVLLLIISFMMATQLDMELMPAIDEGTIDITIQMRPGTTIEKADGILTQVEEIISAEENMNSYMLTYGGSSSASLTAYLKKDRTMSTDEVAKSWRKQLEGITDSDIKISSVSSMSMMTSESDSVAFILQSAQYDDLKQVSDRLVSKMMEREDITRVHSTLENAAPLIKIDIDPVKAAAKGLMPIQVSSSVNQMLSGVKATVLEQSGQEIRVMVEYPDGQYETIDQIQNITLMTQTGSQVPLSEIAQIVFEDSPISITRENKQYQVTISGQVTEFGSQATKEQLYKEVVAPNLIEGVTIATNSMDEMMIEEMSSLMSAIGISIFLIFVVMAAQFESPKFSLMVMTTVPFSLIGSFGLLYMTDVSLSMPSMLGFIMLVGTVVNNGILYIDTVNQYRATMDMKTAIIEAGATRLRPIFMTTLTTILAMVPMTLGLGDSGALMQGLALVNVGGLLASTVLSLLMLPIYYTIMNKKRKSVLQLDEGGIT